MIKLVSIDQRLQDTNFHGTVTAFWPASVAGYGARVFVKEPSNAMKEILNTLSMWGGPDKEVDGVKSWEFGTENLILLMAFCNKFGIEGF